MRRQTLKVEVKLTVEVEVDGFPPPPEDIEATLGWQANRYSDGRYPFSTEQLHDAAEQLVSRGLTESMFQHACRHPMFEKGQRVELRDAWISKKLARIKGSPRADVGENKVEFNVTLDEEEYVGEGERKVQVMRFGYLYDNEERVLWLTDDEHEAREWARDAGFATYAPCFFARIVRVSPKRSLFKSVENERERKELRERETCVSGRSS